MSGLLKSQEVDTFNLFDGYMELEMTKDSSSSPLVMDSFAHFPNALAVTF